MLSHLLGKRAQANARKVINGEPDVSGIVLGKDALEVWTQRLIGHSSLELGKPKFFDNALEQNLDKDATARRGFILVEVYRGHAMPAEGVDAKHVAKELGNVAQLVVFVAMYGVIVLGEGLLEQIAPEAVNLGKTLSNEAKELCVRLFLRTALDNHGGEFRFLTGGEVDLHELVHCLFRVGTGHDCEVDCSSEIDKVHIGLVLDFHCLCLLVFCLVLGALIAPVIVAVVIVVAALAKDLGL
jgi:hypothetical protein